VWEDGCCGHASCSAGSEAHEAGCEPGTSVCTLVRKVMASQIHVVGEGQARIVFSLLECS